jgi:hypothetical protein
LYLFAVLLPESFRGGCSFGVERSDLSRDSIVLILVIRGEDTAIQIEDGAVNGIDEGSCFSGSKPMILHFCD